MAMQPRATLRNVLFPVWMLVWIPSWLWLLLIPLNYLIDYFVLYCSLPGDPARKPFCRRHAWKVCLAGFAGDFAGSLFLLAVLVAGGHAGSGPLGSAAQGISFNPFAGWLSFSLVLAAVILSALCIYRLDLRILCRAGLSPEQCRTSALRIALATAPYLFFFPSEILYP